MSDSGERGGSWTLLTGHGRVLVEIDRDPGARIRDISAVVGLTERTVQVIVADLEAAGYLTRTRTGRRTRYTVNHDSLFRHPAQEGQRVGPFLSLLAAADEDARTTPEPDDTEIGSQQTLRAIPPGAGPFSRLVQSVAAGPKVSVTRVPRGPDRVRIWSATCRATHRP